MASPGSSFSDSHARRKKVTAENGESSKIAVAKQLEPSAGYDEYLILLQQRNKVLEKFKDKGEKQRELERKEQGFCLYVNGANLSGKARAGRPSPRRGQSRKLESALEAREMESMLSKSRHKGTEPEMSLRSRTAPEKSRRKVWAASSMQIKTGSGQKMHVHAPDHVTGHYDDDFDDYVSESFESPDSAQSISDKLGNEEAKRRSCINDNSDSSEMDEESVEEHISDDEVAAMASQQQPGRADERLMLSIAELQVLRKSLVMNPNICQSGQTHKNDTPESEDEKEEEVLFTEHNKQKKQVPALQQLQPNDVIVLEFAPRRSTTRHIDGPAKIRSDGQQAALSNVSHNAATQRSIMLKTSIAGNARPPLSKIRQPSAGSRKSKAGLLSSPRKVSTAEAIESSAERSAVIAALQTENERLHLYSSPAAARSQSPPAFDSGFVSNASPCRGSTKECFSSTVGASVSGAAYSNAVKLAIERALQMDPEQQRKLLTSLEHLEKAASDSSTSLDRRQLTHDSRISRITPTESSTKNEHQQTLVTMEWVTNWGHKSRIGMTEVQLFDSCNKQATICLSESEHAPHALHAIAPAGKVTYLFNQKFKTVKEKNMFSCAYDKDTPVVITFVAVASAPLSYFKLWNYNRSMEDLGIGARRIRLSVKDKIIFDGDLDKGCGNQVFDYSTVVHISTVTSSQGAEVQSSSSTASGIIQQPLLEKGDASFSAENSECLSKPPSPLSTEVPNSGLPPATKTLGHPFIKGTASETANQSKHKVKSSQKAQMPMVSKRMTAHLAHITGASGLDAESSQNGHAGSTSRVTSGDSAVKPFWLPQRASTQIVHSGTNGAAPDIALTSNEKPSWLKKESNDKIHMLHEESSRSQPGCDELTALPSWPRKGILHLHTVLDEPTVKSQPKVADHKALDVADDQEEAKWRKEASASQAAKTGRGRGPDQRLGGSSSVSRAGGMPAAIATLFDEAENGDGTSTANEDVTPLKRIERLRARWRNNRDLEKSWSSLSAFSHNQRGRISMDLEGDVLDEYLRSMRGSAASLDRSVNPANEAATGATPASVSTEQLLAHRSLAPPATTDFEGKERTAKDGVLTDDVTMAATHMVGNDDEDFMIPELPYGKELTLNIKTTWGDRYYVGLNGIEIFTSTGEPAAISKISADPADVNMLPGYGNDPRVVQNLIDGVNRTRDDIHMWLAPFTPGSNHSVFITFEKPCHVALMRLWNYNKSRIHSYRGAKDVEVSLDGKFIFKGEIARACGSTQGGTEAFGDTILFTTSEEILEAISHYDEYYEGAEHDDSESEENEDERPATADNGSDERPFTSVNVRKCAAAASDDDIDHDSKNIGYSSGDAMSHRTAADNDVSARMVLAPTSQPSPVLPHTVSQDGDILVYKGRKLVLNFVDTWGDQFYLGLTGLELIGPDGSALPIAIDAMDACPRDLHVLAGYENDSRTLDKLIDGTNITTSDDHMWLIPYASGRDHKLTFTFEVPASIVGLRFWNYNKSPEDTYRGAKVVHVELDGLVLSPPSGLLIRKAPGNCFFDFAQELIFFEVHKRCTYLSASPALTNDVKKQEDDISESYLSPVMPMGFIYQFHLLSTWGDHYYIGLNGLEFFDENGKKIKLDENNIAAYPQSVNVLDNISGDVRTPDKLIDGMNDGKDPQHTWLAPILPGLTNRVFVIFDQPQTVSMIKMWNYSKTAQRGVKEFALLVDDLLVWNGQLKAVTHAARGILPITDVPQSYHTILFTSDVAMMAREKHTIISNLHEEQDIRMTNDSKVVTASGKQKSFAQKVVADQALRPKTSVTNNKKSHMRK